MKIRILPILFLLFVITGCSAAPTATIPTQVVSPPSSENANVVGRILSKSNGQPYPGEYVFLAVVNYNEAGDGAYFLDTTRSPTTQMDEKGFFQFKDVPPSDYVVIVGEPSGTSSVVTEQSTGNAKIVKVEANKVIDLGEVRLNLGE